MAISNGYLTLAEFKAAIGGVSGSDKDADIERAIEGASRSIDQYTRRRFWQDPTAVTRYYTATDASLVVTDDISTTTGLVVKTDPGDDGTFEVTWTVDADFRLTPVNAAADSEPWTAIERIRTGSYVFPNHEHRVSVTAKFGWASVPTDIETACLIEALRLYKRKDAPFGVAGTDNVGVIRLFAKIDPDAEKLIRPHRRVRLPGLRVAV